MSGGAFVRGALLVAAGAAAGGIAGALVAAGPAAAPGGPAADTASLDARIDELERRLKAQPERLRRERVRVGGDAAAAPGDTAPLAFPSLDGRDVTDPAQADGPAADGDSPGDAPRGEAAAAPSPQFVEAVRLAIDEIKRDAAEGAAERKLRAEREKKIAELRRSIPEIASRLGLDYEEAAQLGRTALAGAEAVLAARAEGRPDEEVRGLERQGHRAVRDFLGSARYRDMRKIELDAAARPTIAKVASLAGVDREQRDRIEGLLTRHIDTLVDDEIRARTEELPGEERAAIRTRLDAANRTAWDRIRNEILDAEQRERVPARLR